MDLKHLKFSVQRRSFWRNWIPKIGGKTCVYRCSLLWYPSSMQKTWHLLLQGCCL